MDEESSPSAGSDARNLAAPLIFCEDDTMYGIFMGPTTKHEEVTRRTLQSAIAKNNDTDHSQQRPAGELGFQSRICETAVISDTLADDRGVALENMSCDSSPEAGGDDGLVFTSSLRSLRPRKRVTLSPSKTRRKITDKSVRSSLPHFPTKWSSIPSTPPTAMLSAHASASEMAPGLEDAKASPADPAWHDSVDLISDGLTGTSLDTNCDIPRLGKEHEAEITDNADALILVDAKSSMRMTSAPELQDYSTTPIVDAAQPETHNAPMSTSVMDEAENSAALSTGRGDGKYIITRTIPQLTVRRQPHQCEGVYLWQAPRRICLQVII